jgi:hypothetical protein
VDKVRLFWCLVLIFALSFAVAVLSWAAGELADGADFTSITRLTARWW